MIEYLSPTDHLVRASMTLRGVRPSVADLQAVHADPTKLDGIVEGYLSTPEFAATMRDLHNEALLVQTDLFIYPAGFPAMGPLSGLTAAQVDTAVQEAPLRLIEYVITHDRPYTEIVTADYTVADAVVASVWNGVLYTGSGPGDWELARWMDGRDNAGILSDSWLYQRYSSTFSNANRGRANAISRSLLCNDFVSHEISIGSTTVNLGDPAAVSNAVMTNQACVGCHQTLDPLASHFKEYFPIFVPSVLTQYPFPEWGIDYFDQYFSAYGITMRPAGYFGEASDGKLKTLGQLIAEDPRFSLCAAKHFYAYMNQIALDEVSEDVAATYQNVLIQNGMNAKALAKAIALSDDFRVQDALDDGDAANLVGYRKARPAELARMFYDLTGFAWTFTLPPNPQAPGLYDGTVDLTNDSFLGYKVLSGGLDSFYVNKASYTMNATASLALQALAAQAASFVVDADFALPNAASRKLLTLVGASDTGEAAIRAQLAALHLRLYGEFVGPNDPLVDESYTLFSSALAHDNDTRRAWKTTLSALFQDSRIAYY
jgi:hypothetical protein